MQDKQIAEKYRFEDLYTIKLGSYTFRIRPEEKRSLKKRLRSDEDFRTAALEKNAKDLIKAAIEYTVRFQSNSVFQITGIPESGKSTVAQSLCYWLLQEFEKYEKQTVLEVTYDYAETLHKLREYALAWDDGVIDPEKKLVILQDEHSELSGPESRTYVNAINTILEQMRASQICIIFVSPNWRKYSVCNLYLEVLGKDYERRTNWVVVYTEAKTMTDTLKLNPEGAALITWPHEAEVLFSDYKEHKMKMIRDRLRKRGITGIEIPEDVLEELIQYLLSEAQKNNVRTKEQLKSLAFTLDLGSTGQTKVIAELAGIRFESEKLKQKEEKERKEKERKEKEKKERHKLLTKKVNKIARELYEAFDFVNPEGLNKKSFSRLVKGWLIEHYPEEWQVLIQHAGQMWALAEYWQLLDFKNKPPEPPKTRVEYHEITSHRELLRKAVEQSILARYNDPLLAFRLAYYFIPDEDETIESWSIQKAARAISRVTGVQMKYSAARKYFHEHKEDIIAIKNNSKIWGDAGELYFAARVRKKLEQFFSKKGEPHNSLKPGVLPIELSVAAEERRGGADVEVFVVGVGGVRVSLCQVNVKYSFVDDQSFKVLPEGLHARPFLFVLDKSRLTERLFCLEKGKTLVSVGSGGVQSEGVEEWSLEQFVEWVMKQVDVK